MQRNNTTFELNGRSYDTLTGAMLGAAPHRRPAGTASIDGMVSAKKPALNISGTAHRTTHAQHVAAHRPQPTKTLMRHAVKAPSPLSGIAPKSAYAVKHTAVHAKQFHQASTSSKIGRKLSSDAIDPRRATNAASVNQNTSVRRFAPVSTPTQPMLVPAPVQVTSRAATPAQRPVRSHNEFSAPTRRPVSSATPQSLRSSAVAYQTPRPPVAPKYPDPNHNKDQEDIFRHALAQATSHKQSAPDIKTRKSRRKTLRAWSLATMATVLVALFGFVAFQNRDDIRLQIASAKAGFSAAAPLYKPDGYKLSDMKYASGSVASLYQQGNQNFQITQTKSNWDSQTLLENFVSSSNEDYEGFQSNGRTVYVYGKGNATWVNGGIWYQIKSTGNLTSEQLVKIAASM